MPVFKSKYHVFDLFDIPIYIDLSLIVLLVFFATSGTGILEGLFCAVILLVSITAHEFGHSLTARAFGYETNDITLSLLGGCASLIALPRKASQEFLTAIAGPAVSFALSGIGWLLLTFLPPEALFQQIGYNQFMPNPLCQLLVYLMYMNLMLGGFNLLPGFPLDGGRVFRSLMRSFMPRARATYVAMIVGRVVAVGIGLMGLWRIMNGRGWGFVTVMIAWMIWKEGYREYLIAQAESGWDARDYGFRVSPPPYER